MSDIVEQWNNLRLETLEVVPMTGEVYQAIAARSDEAIKLFTVKREICGRIKELGRNCIVDPANDSPAILHPINNQMLGLMLQVNQELSIGASILFANARVKPDVFKAGRYIGERTPYLHPDRKTEDKVLHEWNLTGRIGSLPILTANKADLLGVNQKLVSMAQIHPKNIRDNGEKGLSYGFTVEEQREAMQYLIEQVLWPLDLDSIYLMRTTKHPARQPSKEPVAQIEDPLLDGCQHASSPVPPDKNDAISCFIRSMVIEPIS